MKRALLILAIFLGGALTAFAGERDDLTYLDELYSQKKFSLAIEESNKFISAYPKSRYIPRVAERLAKTYFLEGDYANAAKFFKLTADTNKKQSDDELNYYLMRAYAAMGNKKESDYYQLLIGRSSEYYQRGVYEVGMEYIARENYSAAAGKLEELVLSGGKYKNDALLGLALMDYNSKKYDAAAGRLNQLGQIKQNDKNFAVVNYLLGSVAAKTNKKTQAMEYFKAVTDKDATSTYGKRSLVSLAELYMEANRTADVEKLLGAVQSDKEKNEIYVMLGDGAADSKNYAKAVSYYQKNTDPKNLQAIYGLGYSYYRQGQYAEARKQFDKLANTSYYARSLFYSFNCDFKLKDYKRILEKRNVLDKVKLSQDDAANIREIIANAAYETGDMALANTYYRDIYGKNQSAENLYKVIVVAAKNGDIPSLEKAFGDYVKAWPDDAVYRTRIYNAMGTTYYDKNRINDAIDIYKQYLEKGEDPTILENLKAMLLNTKRYGELLTYLEKSPVTAENNYLKGIAALGLADYDKAKKSFDLVIADGAADPELSAKAKLGKVRTDFLNGKYQDTIKDGDAYLTLKDAPDKEEVLDKIGISWFRLDNFAKSRETYEKLAGNPQYDEYANFQIAESWYGEKNLQKARESYKAVYDRFPNGEYSEKAYYWYLNTLANMGDMSAFDRDKGLFLEKYPKSQMRDNILMLSGAVYETMKDNEKAVEYYQNLYDSSKNENIKANAAERIMEILLINNKVEDAKKFVVKMPEGEMKMYYSSIIYEKDGNEDAALKEYEKLKSSPKYGDYAYLNSGTYYFAKKDFAKARENYQKSLDMEKSKYKDLATFQLAACDEMEGNWEQAYRGYTKCYVLYLGKYYQVAKIKAGQMAEKTGKLQEAINIYKELYQMGDALSYKEFVTERMVYYSIKSNRKDEARKYNTELARLNQGLADKYAEIIK
ncbi:MAG: tetratricopeptide repeat protein [Fusobacteriaceae bacterium]|jgi:tetratricopeptide (TPR) repeat protein|nr:tetratricopeptide repeat protein [Fusobacteriaceae bacterium]